MMKFTHEFEEDPPMGILSVDLELPADAIAGVRVDGNAVLLYANARGFDHLARVFAELGTRPLEEEFHFHCGPNFEHYNYDRNGIELTVMRLNKTLPIDVKMVGGNPDSAAG
jgi:hypothetical protein